MLTLRQARRLRPFRPLMCWWRGRAGGFGGVAAARVGAKTLIGSSATLGGRHAGEHAHICLYSAWASARRVGD